AVLRVVPSFPTPRSSDLIAGPFGTPAQARSTRFFRATREWAFRTGTSRHLSGRRLVPRTERALLGISGRRSASENHPRYPSPTLDRKSTRLNSSHVKNSY